MHEYAISNIDSSNIIHPTVVLMTQVGMKASPLVWCTVKAQCSLQGTYERWQASTWGVPTNILCTYCELICTKGPHRHCAMQCVLAVHTLVHKLRCQTHAAIGMAHSDNDCIVCFCKYGDDDQRPAKLPAVWCNTDLLIVHDMMHWFQIVCAEIEHYACLLWQGLAQPCSYKSAYD